MSAPERLRLFVAARVPDEHLATLRDRTESLRSRWPQARWTETANQHLTLKFLGSTPVDLLERVRSVCAGAAGAQRTSEARLAGLGAFASPRRARVLWAGIDEPAGVLASAARALDGGFEPLGYATEKRDFSPHLTLARFRVPERVEPLPELDLADLAPFAIASFDLFRSYLSPKGARYEVLETFPFGGA